MVDFEAQALNSHTGFARNPESRIQNPEYRWSPDSHGSPKMCVTEPRELGIQNPESRIQNTDGAPTHMVLVRQPPHLDSGFWILDSGFLRSSVQIASDSPPFGFWILDFEFCIPAL